ncbi:hypothetical protein D3C81_1824060 [compost metagenome]
MVELFAVYDNFAALILCQEAKHQGMGKRPLLAAEVVDVLDLKADFLHNLTLYTVLQCLAWFNKAGNQPVHVVLEMRSMGEQELLILENRGNHRRGKPGIAH